MILCATKLAIEAKFIHVYTHETFREVQAQFRGKVNCITRSMHSTLGFTTYKVVEQVSNSTFNKFLVTSTRITSDKVPVLAGHIVPPFPEHPKLRVTG
ncbi:hypothetical protein Ahy_A04g019307 [Arachis hypogaea]|uniref:Uncharacterized protein n=1 Tax=Arachis hypogaea TaxID=3818 RepID=A0A445DFP1_ARAHY|nr:hypothetical protein Ahy_A04g019307 [Arachis hypogaea]